MAVRSFKRSRGRKLGWSTTDAKDSQRNCIHSSKWFFPRARSFERWMISKEGSTVTSIHGNQLRVDLPRVLLARAQLE